MLLLLLLLAVVEVVPPVTSVTMAAITLVVSDASAQRNKSCPQSTSR
jgi:hypothetical protein